MMMVVGEGPRHQLIIPDMKNTDLPIDLLYREGNIWINGKNKHLRYSTGKDNNNSWINPISTYFVGSFSKIKKGQPVSIGKIEQLDEEWTNVGPAAIVKTDPQKNQWCIGLALEPGDSSSKKEIHVQSHGQLEYELSKRTNDDYYLPPYSFLNNHYRFDWNYNDVGKPVYVSNAPGHVGELTLNLSDATFDGSTIICVGRLADAPLGTESSEEQQKILIEIQLSGDVRGVVDSTQLAITIAEEDATVSTTIIDTNGYDRIIYVKDVENKGYLITNDAALENDPKNSPIGAFVAHPDENGKIDIEQYFGQTITVTRLGILEGNFGFTESDIGKTAYLRDGKIDFSQGSSSVEFKTGICFGLDKFLVDCRFTKELATSEMIGTIKPVFGDNLLDSGFALVDKNVHTVYNEKIDWVPLLRNCYAKDIFLFSKSKDGPFTRVHEGGWELLGEATETGILSHSRPTYFKFRDLYYTIKDDNTGEDLKCNCQIKYSPEGTPESQAYIWPEQCYQLTVPYVTEGTAGGKVNNSNLRINISHLVGLGAYMDNNSQNIEAYDIVVQEASTGMILSPGFWKNGDTWCGYEWQIQTIDDKTFLYMITVPETAERTECYGPTWPIGEKIAKDLELYVTVRRRPTQYNSVYLNQFPYDNPWTPLVDSANNLVIQGDKIYLGGTMEKNATQDGGFTRGPSSSFIEITPNTDNSVSFNMATSSADTKIIQQRFLIGSGPNVKEVVWEYNFTDGDSPTVKLNADFAPNLISRDTSLVQDEEKLEIDALLVLRALGVNKAKFSPIEDFSYITSYKNINDYISNGVYGTVCSEADKNDLQNSDWFLGANDLNVIDAIKNVFKNKKMIQIVSNIGLLNKAASDTEDRLLSIERTLYGADYSTRPGGRKQTIEYNNQSDELLRNDHYGNFGYPRLLEWMSSRLLYKEDIGPNLGVGYASGNVRKNGVISLLDTFIVDNYGYYDGFSSENGKRTNKEALADYEKAADAAAYIADSFERGGYTKSHLAEVWTFYKNLAAVHYIPNMTKSIDLDTFGGFSPSSFKYHDLLTSASDIIPFKVLNGYDWDTKIELDAIGQQAVDLTGVKGHGFTWPIQSESGFKLSLAANFFQNSLFGISDGEVDFGGKGYYASKDNSFGAQSLEGYLYDIIVKLSYIHSIFDDYQLIDSKKTWIKQYLYLDASPENEQNYLNFISNDSIVFNDYLSDESIYAGFQFSKDKAVRGYGMALLEKTPVKRMESVKNITAYWEKFLAKKDFIGDNRLFVGYENTTKNKNNWPYKVQPLTWDENNFNNFIEKSVDAETTGPVLTGEISRKFNDDLPSSVGGFSIADSESEIKDYLKQKLSNEEPTTESIGSNEVLKYIEDFEIEGSHTSTLATVEAADIKQVDLAKLERDISNMMGNFTNQVNQCFERMCNAFNAIIGSRIDGGDYLNPEDYKIDSSAYDHYLNNDILADHQLDIKVAYDKYSQSVEKTQKFAIFNGVDNVVKIPTSIEQHVEVNGRDTSSWLENHFGETKNTLNVYSNTIEKTFDIEETTSDVITENIRFKDNAYINGQQLPCPDAIFDLTAVDILGLVDIYPTAKPINKNKLVGSVYSDEVNFERVAPKVYDVQDIFNRYIQISVNGGKNVYELKNLKVFDFGIRPAGKDPINRVIYCPTLLDEDTGSWRCETVLKNGYMFYGNLSEKKATGNRFVVDVIDDASNVKVYYTKDSAKVNMNNPLTYDGSILADQESVVGTISVDLSKILGNIKDNLCAAIMEGQYSTNENCKFEFTYDEDDIIRLGIIMSQPMWPISMCDDVELSLLKENND